MPMQRWMAFFPPTHFAGNEDKKQIKGVSLEESIYEKSQQSVTSPSTKREQQSFKSCNSMLSGGSYDDTETYQGTLSRGDSTMVSTMVTRDHHRLDDAPMIHVSPVPNGIPQSKNTTCTITLWPFVSSFHNCLAWGAAETTSGLSTIPQAMECSEVDLGEEEETRDTRDDTVSQGNSTENRSDPGKNEDNSKGSSAHGDSETTKKIATTDKIEDLLVEELLEADGQETKIRNEMENVVLRALAIGQPATVTPTSRIISGAESNRAGVDRITVRGAESNRSGVDRITVTRASEDQSRKVQGEITETLNGVHRNPSFGEEEMKLKNEKGITKGGGSAFQKSPSRLRKWANNYRRKMKTPSSSASTSGRISIQ